MPAQARRIALPRAARIGIGIAVTGVSFALPLVTAMNAQAHTAPAAPVAQATAGTEAKPAAPAAAPAAHESYRVVSGDSLSKIAEAKRVDGGWQALYEQNRSVVGANPNLIFPGQQLAIAGHAAAPAVDAAPAKPAAPVTQAASAAKPKAQLQVTTEVAKPSAQVQTQVQTAAPAPAATGSMAAAVSFAESKVGQAYVYGGTGNGGWDCSGLTQAALRAAGISVPRVAADQAAASTHVSLDSLQPGDLLFWSNNGQDSGVYHVAIYVGGGKYVEAANPSAGVREQTIANWAPDFAGRV